MEELKEKAVVLNGEQEILKGNLKKKTEALEGIFAEAMKMHSEAKKMVKVAILQSEWVKFGITDKK